MKFLKDHLLPVEIEHNIGCDIVGKLPAVLLLHYTKDDIRCNLGIIPGIVLKKRTCVPDEGRCGIRGFVGGNFRF